MKTSGLNALIAPAWPALRDAGIAQLRARLAQPLAHASTRHGFTFSVNYALDPDGLTWTRRDAAPGFQDGTNPVGSDVVLAAPANGTWDISLRGHLRGSAKFDGFPLLSFDQPLAISLTGLQLQATANLDGVDGATSQPLAGIFPQLRDISLSPAFRLQITGAIELDTKQVDITRYRNRDNGTYAYLLLDTTDDEPERDAALRFLGTVWLTPTPPFHLSVAGRLVVVESNGTTSLDYPITAEEDLFSTALGDPALYGWGKDNPQATTAPDAGFDPIALARDVEERFVRHSPFVAGAGGKTPTAGTTAPDAPAYLAVMDNRYAVADLAPPAPGSPLPAVTLHGSGDSAIWTGHLLAALAFRYAAETTAPGKADALARIGSALAAIERLRDVPAAFLAAGVPRGLLCRAALPADLAALAPGDFGADRLPYNYADVSLAGETQPWAGKGRGDGDPPSRDSHVGVLLGLTAAVQLLPASGGPADGADLRSRAGGMLLDVLDYVVKHGGWAVPTPAGPLPNPPAPAADFAVKTSYFCGFMQQLALLRIGASTESALGVDRGYGALYRRLAPSAATACWLDIWMDCLDVTAKYYKFNLDHGALGALLWLEPADSPLRPAYEAAMALLRETVGHHRNAYFDLIWVLSRATDADRQAALAAPVAGSVRPDPTTGVDTPLSLMEEVSCLLFEWSLRLADGEPVGPNGLPLQYTGDPTLRYLADLKGEGNSAVAMAPGAAGAAAALWSISPLPCHRRTGKDRDFLWQRDPFATGYAADGTLDRGDTGTDGSERVEAPGVDYLLACWMARYLGVV